MQKILFLSSEGDRWLERNRDALVNAVETDPVSAAIIKLGLKPHSVLEVGCSNGWRLAHLRDTYGCRIMGVEPSRQACIEAAARQVPAIQSTASSLSLSTTFDVVIYGFCLYLTDPEDWLRIVAEGDAVLAAGGHLIIHDFADLSRPFARKYQHCEGVFSYHFDFASLWLSHPLYNVVYRDMLDANQYMVTVLKKSHPSLIKVMPW